MYINVFGSGAQKLFFTSLWGITTDQGEIVITFSLNGTALQEMTHTSHLEPLR